MLYGLLKSWISEMHAELICKIRALICNYLYRSVDQWIRAMSSPLQHNYILTDVSDVKEQKQRIIQKYIFFITEAILTPSVYTCQAEARKVGEMFEIKAN